VLERQDTVQRGKGFALDFGLRQIAANPPDVVIIVDADCTLRPDALSQLASAALASGRPVHGAYLMSSPPQPSSRDLISQCAVTIKNLVRPLGLARLGLPCPLAGSGMAFPWALIGECRLASGHIVEDMQLGIDLLLAGHAPLFCPGARIDAALPGQQSAAKSQRRRWEHGHIQVLLSQTPRLLWSAIRRFSVESLGAALDLSVPPLSLLVLLWSLALSAALGAIALGTSWAPAAVLAAVGLAMASCVLAAWLRFASPQVSLRAVAAVPQYVLLKIPMYLAFLVARQQSWVRTARDPGLVQTPGDG
jgi:cellulose synthase/poly-beta-1,6-N-acetylglucosamine synthase-like glycosyltransferase